MNLYISIKSQKWGIIIEKDSRLLVTGPISDFYKSLPGKEDLSSPNGGAFKNPLSGDSSQNDAKSSLVKGELSREASSSARDDFKSLPDKKDFSNQSDKISLSELSKIQLLIVLDYLKKLNLDEKSSLPEKDNEIPSPRDIESRLERILNIYTYDIYVRNVLSEWMYEWERENWKFRLIRETIIKGKDKNKKHEDIVKGMRPNYEILQQIMTIVKKFNIQIIGHYDQDNNIMKLLDSELDKIVPSACLTT